MNPQETLKLERREQFLNRVQNMFKNDEMSLMEIVATLIRKFELPISGIISLVYLDRVRLQAEKLGLEDLDSDMFVLRKFLERYDLDINPNIDLSIDKNVKDERPYEGEDEEFSDLEEHDENGNPDQITDEEFFRRLDKYEQAIRKKDSVTGWKLRY